MSSKAPGPTSVSAPAPPSLANVLRLAGFQGVVVVERLDQQPMTPDQADLARGIVEMHEEEFSDEEISRAVAQTLKKQSSEQPASEHQAPTGTGGE